MKNIHILPTDKPSRIHVDLRSTFLTPNYQIGKEINSVVDSINIYITSDEEIKEGDWCFYVNNIYKVLRISSNNRPIIKMSDGTFEISYYKKIILTTDQDLIKDGVQAIDDEFLEWFVNNPSCEEVEVTYEVLKPFQSEDKGYLIHCPDNEVLEEPKQDLEKEMFELEQELDIPSHLRRHNSKSKQETLEEAAKRFYSSEDLQRDCNFIEGAKWQQERMYSEEEARIIWRAGQEYWKTSGDSITFEELTEKFKNK